MARLENIGAFYFFFPLFKYKSSSLPKCNPELVTSRHQWVAASLSEGVRKGLGAAQEGTETSGPEDGAHPGHGMSFGKGERAAQPALCPVPRQAPQLPASNLPELCSQPCPGTTAP